MRIVILRPNKGNGVVTIDKIACKLKMYELLNDESKFKQLSSDPTKLHEGQLQRYLRKLNNKRYSDKIVYDCIYPEGSLLSWLYGAQKVRKIKDKSDEPLIGLSCRQLIVITTILQVINVNY